MSKRLIAILAFIVIGSVLAAQQYSLRQLRSEQRTLSAQLNHLMPQPETDGAPSAAAENWTGFHNSGASGDAQLDQRLGAMEEQVRQLRRAAEHLMQRGQVPLSPSMIEETRRKFFDTSANGWDRLQMLRLLRRNRVATDDVMEAAALWLAQSNNADLTANILEQLDGLTNAFLRAPTLQLVTASNAELRRRAIENLRRFAGDPQVEEALWNALRTDANQDVRNQARDSLRENPPTPARLAALQQRVLNAQASLDERLTALEIMRQADADVSQAAAGFLASNTPIPDDEQRARFYGALQGTTDAAFLPALVQGVQDANASVRQRAARALAGHKTDATALQWLQYLAQSDPDQRVRRAASRAMGEQRE